MQATVLSPGTASRSALGDRPLVRWGREHPLASCWGAAVLLGVLSGIVWPTIASYDPFSWIVWGHSISSGAIPFYIGDGPSWKPLPFFFTTIYGIFGSPAPWLWVVTARIGGIAGLIGAIRICHLLCQKAKLPLWTTLVAGLIAIAGIVLANGQSLWTYYFFRGASETLLIGVWVWAVERVLVGKLGQAYVLVALEGWMRPEAWPFQFVFGVYLFWRDPKMRMWVVLWLISEPIAWFVPPWISTGQPFLAANHASAYEPLGPGWFKTVVDRGESIQPLSNLILGFLGSVGALWFGRHLLIGLAKLWRRPTALFARIAEEHQSSVLPSLLTLAGLAAAWWVVVIVETADHYPGLQRFYLPADAMICVLSGFTVAYAAVWIAQRVPSSTVVRTAIAAVICAIVCVGSWHWLSPRWKLATQQEPLAEIATHRIGELGDAIRAAGGLKRILPCPSSEITINHSLQTAMAWELGTDLKPVKTFFATGDKGVAFVGPKDSIDGSQPDIYYDFTAKVVATAGAWSVQQVYPKGSQPGACVGS